MKIFAVNPGSTSTKVGLFEDYTMIFSANVSHDAARLNEFSKINDQLSYRKEVILESLNTQNITLKGVAAFVGRGGLSYSMECGTYSVTDRLLEHIKFGVSGEHASNLGAQLVNDFACMYGGAAFIVNPPIVDEMSDIARASGLKEISRQSLLHALNQKEVALRCAAMIGKKYEELNLVVAHLGGGISITSHRKGRMVDTTDALRGDGPMAPTRSGALPACSLIELCFSGRYKREEMYSLITRTGGIVNHLGTSDISEVRKRIDAGDNYARYIYDAMIYQIGKYIGAYATVLNGVVDRIILTGGLANDNYLVENLSTMVRFIASIMVLPGEFELEALAAGVMRVQNGEEVLKVYTGIPVWSGF